VASSAPEATETPCVKASLPALALAAPAPVASSGITVDSPMAGHIIKINVEVGDQIAEGDVVLIMEAMKMETEVRSKTAGTVSAISVKEGDNVAVGDPLVVL